MPDQLAKRLVSQPFANAAIRGNDRQYVYSIKLLLLTCRGNVLLSRYMLLTCCGNGGCVKPDNVY